MSKFKEIFVFSIKLLTKKVVLWYYFWKVDIFSIYRKCWI